MKKLVLSVAMAAVLMLAASCSCGNCCKKKAAEAACDSCACACCDSTKACCDSAKTCCGECAK